MSYLRQKLSWLALESGEIPMISAPIASNPGFSIEKLTASVVQLGVSSAG